MMERYCIVCGEKISECMGVVLARDFLDFCDGKRDNIRELCGKDSLRRINLRIDMDTYLEMYAN